MTITIKCFKSIADAEPATLPNGKPAVFTGAEYQAISEPPSPSQASTVRTFHRVVLNPRDADPTKQVQVHVRSGDRNPADPLRFERVEVYESKPNQPDDLPATLVWYGDSEGNSAPQVLKSDAEEASDEQSFDELVNSGASVEALSLAISRMDYKSLSDELNVRKLSTPQKRERVDCETALLAAVTRVPDEEKA